jgi:hypothetical protein
MTGDFTGAISGQVQRCTGLTSSATCNAEPYCTWTGTACQWRDRSVNCGTTGNDPSCYFANNLPSQTGTTDTGSEFGLLMGTWALYRYGARPGCLTLTTAAACNARSGCFWYNNACMASNCEQPSCTGYATQAACIAVPGCTWYAGWGCQLGRTDNAQEECNGDDTGTVFADPEENELEPPTCYWNTTENRCWPNLKTSLCNSTSQSTCVTQGGNWCQWDTCSGVTSEVTCAARWGCMWQSGSCVPKSGTGYCRPPLRQAFRYNASKFAIVLSDEEECYLKDHNFDGRCEWIDPPGYGAGSMPYDEPIRRARTESYRRFFAARDFMLFGIVGDKANPSQAVAPDNGGCHVGANQGEAGQAYINVAEGTGGGWGSICAADLYPTIEAIMIASLGRASPYKLEGFLNGRAVQPIASTIKVAVEVCNTPSEYPVCQSGTHMAVVPRSRDNGFDYDSLNNALILYGRARPVVGGDIVVSYRYWVDLPQPPAGDPDCPCPQTNLPGCACPSGQACGLTGTVSGGLTNQCTSKGTQATCEATPGCAWNTATGGGCMATGLCEPDPGCGGACPPGTICDPNLGLCVCDPTCGSMCGTGERCDNNNNIHPCQSAPQSSCDTLAGCDWDSPRGACYSDTCGECLCDTTCGGGCPVGQFCDSSLTSPTCGQCACDITCGGGCDVGETCNDGTACAGLTASACAQNPLCAVNPSTGACYSPSCGFCQPPQCGNCPAGFVCDYDTGLCICDQTCGGACPDGRYCQSDTNLPACGQCLCKTDCGQAACAALTNQTACQAASCVWSGSRCDACASGAACDGDTLSATCGLCLSSLDCGGGCNATCSFTTQAACNGSPSCRWAPWLNGGAGGCHPLTCKNCDTSAGMCLTDPTCCSACGASNIPTGGNPADSCNMVTGSCKCDTSCGGGCPTGRICDSNPAHIATCGQCLCDPTCGGACGAGTLCDSNQSSPTCGLCLADPSCGGACNPPCAHTTAAACNGDSLCRWATSENGGAGGCLPRTCKVCNPSIGLCTLDPTCCDYACDPGDTCNTVTGQCECLTNCGGACPGGTRCDGNTQSPTCGQCVCDTTCGGACPNGTLCDTNPASPSCGWCVADPTCGRPSGNCNPACAYTSEATCRSDNACRWAPWSGPAGKCFPAVCQLCNPSVGFCQPDPQCCGACGPTETCNALTGRCECDTDCNLSCAPGQTCDSNPQSATCGQCRCDTTCGGGCQDGQVCDNNAACAGLDPITCGTKPECIGNEAAGTCDSVTCGLCVVDPTCGGCPPGYVCNPTTGLCEPQCPDCPVGQVCDPLTGQCICDQTCGRPCPLGSQCDGLKDSPTCGQCICETSCGSSICQPLGTEQACLNAGCFWNGTSCGVCRPGTFCDDGSACSGLSTAPGGACATSDACELDPSGARCISPTCGLCVVDPLCGEPCPPGFVCDPLTGLCVPLTSCDCPPGEICNPVTLFCVPDPG